MMKYILFIIAVIYTKNVQAEEPFSDWHRINTTLSKIGIVPGCEASVDSLPPIYQEMVLTYCNVKIGGPGKVEILINPLVIDAYKARKGDFPDGDNFSLHFVELNIHFVTYYKNGKPYYKVLNKNGLNITSKDSTSIFSNKTCVSCHTGFTSYCKNGQCGQVLY